MISELIITCISGFSPVIPIEGRLVAKQQQTALRVPARTVESFSVEGGVYKLAFGKVKLPSFNNKVANITVYIPTDKCTVTEVL